MIAPGDIINISSFEEDTKYVLPRAPSTYCFGDTLELYPNPDSNYIVCNGDPANGYCLCDQNDPSIPIGFVIVYVNDVPCFRITQVGYDPQQVTLQVVGKHVGPLPQRRTIGSHVVVMKVVHQ